MTAPVVTLGQLNQCTPQEFTAALATVFERSPWVAERAAAARPFTSRLDLLDGMRAVVAAASAEEKLRLIREHPPLGIAVGAAQALTEASRHEQRRAGLNDCTPEEATRLRQLNAAYAERFGFPFIMAVRGQEPASILAHMQRRLQRDARTERLCALANIGRIAGYRLAGLVRSPAAGEILAMHARWQRQPVDAAGPDGDAVPLLQEWMLAAELEVGMQAGSWVAGSWRCGAPLASTVLAGVRYVPEKQRLVDQGPLSAMIAIAVIAHLRQTRRQLPYDLTVFAQLVNGARARNSFEPDDLGDFTAVGPARDPDEGTRLDAGVATWRAHTLEELLLTLRPPFATIQ